ncbi:MULTISPECIES: methyltransferase domain-containing protein [unclassified Lysobacter]|uniref:methyltransferase domain-containing protein n=1 Tax=unclassified Lysobacter TaxID=2635362 RepID=UPI001BE84AB0|nr:MULTISPECIES: methyltransferase domain-containing protein [unclassified Lysobacter]MBT2748717.1 methyltransferase domain-containing protein [Lysobacter sp. ISL-42]MBT2751652.1 methyltransferase domain-containing protein [Lysobacter sp. ISL-50]MBT2775846.1 methyltransferase domain-containing protein [Lysobacter sp. ISL-54]MBT2782190.1 methyltransferase domain-containing protein [Lysobacter sp. ISL-52]
MDKADEYILGYRRQEQIRLQAQARQLAGESRWLFEQIPLPENPRIVEIGCGPQGCLEILSNRAGPSGRVVGVDRSEEAVALAKEWISASKLANVEVRVKDARNTELPRASFDLVTARLVLVNVPEPEQIVAEAAALLKPGGWLALHEADYVSFLCDPPCAAWDALMELFRRYAVHNGIDPYIGRRMPRMLREVARLVDIAVRPIVHVYPIDHERRFIAVDFAENVADRLVDQKLVSGRDVSSLLASLRNHLSDPDTLVISHLFFQAWGRKRHAADGFGQAQE